MGESLRFKTEYARDHHLAGVMIWELSEDDERSSLLNALNEVIHPARPSPDAPPRGPPPAAAKSENCSSKPT